MKKKTALYIPLLALLVLLLAAGLFADWYGGDVFWSGYLAMTVFYCLIFYLGLYAARRKTGDSASEMMLAGRSLPLGIAVFTMGATWVGGGYINGSAEYTTSFGLAWVQAPWGYALSLVVGGLFFARKMRRHGFTTMLDPLEQRYGKKVTALLFVPAITGEIFWTAAILTALGTTFGTVLGLDFTMSIILSAAIAIAYTAIGGLWAVAMTDVLQLLMLFAGLWIVVPFAADSAGGIEAVWLAYQDSKGAMATLFPPWNGWQDPAWGDYYWNWWDYALLLVFGGIPWQVYFQRVLASKDENTAMRLSIFAGFICLLAAIPAIFIGMVGDIFPWTHFDLPAPESPALILPHVVRYLTEPWVATIALGAIAAAVMSSVDSSILSASSLTIWNVYRPLIKPDISAEKLSQLIRRCIWIIGIAALLLALQVKSVYALWFFCSDFVYCILFPQLVTALFDKRANRYGAIAGLAVSFILRFGGGEAVLGIPNLIPYPMIDDAGVILFPFRTFAMVSGLLTITVVSRLTQKKCPPEKLQPQMTSAGSDLLPH